MPSDISFENFQFTDLDRYRKIRNGNKDVSFSYLINYVVADLDKRVIAIDVDDLFIKMWKKLDREELPDDWKHPYLPQAGEIVVNPIGEQIITFCETDIEALIEFPMQMLEIREAILSDDPEAETLRESLKFKKSAPVVKKPTSDEELHVIYYSNYEYLTTIAKDVIRSCLYINIFPPHISKRSYEMFKAYFDYLLALQHEYRKLLDFCFNMDFHAEDLEGITAASRFHLYCGTTNTVPLRSLNMSFHFSRSGFGNIFEVVRDKQAFEEFKKNPAKKLGIQKREPNAFEREYDINPIATELARFAPVPILSSFRCRSLEEMLFLEFEKMLELDMRIKKCRHCGRYFILKGNYQTEYCDRVPEGETQNCQSIGATAKYAQKVKDNPALAIFNKAYKRYHARMKVGSIKPDVFRKWRYEAVVMRDKCLNGEVTAGDFEEWINHCFD